MATVEALLLPSLEFAAENGIGHGEAEARRGFELGIGLIASQAAAARLCLVDVYAAGPAAVALLESTVSGFADLLTRTFDLIEGRGGMPVEIVRALIGGVQKVVYKRLLRGEEEVLGDLAPGLWQWLLSVPPPPGPLRQSRVRTVKALSFEDRQLPSARRSGCCRRSPPSSPRRATRRRRSPRS